MPVFTSLGEHCLSPLKWLLLFHTCRKLLWTFYTFVYTWFFFYWHFQWSKPPLFTYSKSSKTATFFLFFFGLHPFFLAVLYYKWGCKSTPPVGVQVPLFLHSLPSPLVPCEAFRRSESESGLRLALECKTQGKPAFMLTVSFDKVSFWVDIW